MTAMDKVWDRLQDRALLHAEAGDLVSTEDAGQIVRFICDAEGVELTPGTLERLAMALVRLSVEARETHKHPRRGLAGTVPPPELATE